jgi:glycosyltransferase involved in cell wall biosynthesis
MSQNLPHIACYNAEKLRPMKKLLILAYDFPPYVSVGGLRPASWAKYLHEFGVFPVIVTRQWANNYGNALDYIAPSERQEIIIENSDTATIIRTPYKPNWANKILLKYGNKKYRTLRKSITAFYEIFQWIFTIGPKSQLYFAAKEYLKNNTVDCIIATGEPFILFRYASQLSEKFNIPWIADYRDPWVQSSRSANMLQKIWNKYNEKRFLKNATCITTVSDFFKKLISTNIPNKDFCIITNGYEDTVITNVEGITQNSTVLSIGFAGMMYAYHPIESFLRTVHEFVKKSGAIALNFYGINNEPEIRQMIDEKFPQLKQYTAIFPKLKNRDLVKELANNNVLLLFNSYEILGTKIYDYLAVERLILLCYANDKEANTLKEKDFTKMQGNEEGVSHSMQADVIKETNSGIVVENAEHLHSVLTDLHKEFEQNKYIACNSKGIEKYSRRLQAEKLAKIVSEINYKGER